MVMIFLHYISILIEAIIAILGLMILLNKKKRYGLCFFITFAIYVVYDLARALNWSVSTNLLYVSFFVASVSALWAVWEVYNKK
ncbi:MAG: hypothetical protein WCI72_05850 [archaeon]